MNCGNFILLDFETGGKTPEENPIVEVGIYSMRSDNFEEISRYQSYVKNYNNLTIQQEALNYNGIKMSQINSGISIKEAVEAMIEEFIKASNGRGRNDKPHLCGHNFSDFDRKFIEYAFKLCKKDLYKYVDPYIYDTLKMCRATWIEEGVKFSLEACCEKMGIELIDGHGALADVIANAALLKSLLSGMRSGGELSMTKEKRVRDTFKFEY